MRDSYDLMLNIIDLPSLAHRRQLPPRTARQEKLLSCHCEVRVISHRYWRCIYNHQADTPLLFCYPPAVDMVSPNYPDLSLAQALCFPAQRKAKGGDGEFALNGVEMAKKWR